MCVKSLLIIATTFIVLDSIYFTLNNKFFKDLIYSVQKKPVNPNYYAVAITYLLLIGLEYYFIILRNRKAMDAFFLGLGVYGVYEFTNYATLTNWPLSLVLMDTLWGGILFASATCMVKYVF